ncbi:MULTISPECIES: SemiSWEET family transporter [unclassified Capnocytophaga]|jgi:MtN3/saliva family.|uniref:SemiSWEET family transporter n=1 Tax=unclassified Capnocytophaga TaxID=2640652 RepID=UPI000202F177|nr:MULTISPECIES: SemiSWEET family transporter [unclassified Capnocytophaga]EGD33185.1 integral membrane protein [Capnocytophaga sp. oral taxon 338 str. F0234]MEB3005442.1 SemiSWEET family transporter [Capnocytophaga sp. G2]
MENKFIRILGVLAAIMAVAMYVAYIDQIKATWGDATGPWLQPFIAGINCTLWVSYGLFKRERDYPIVFANLPGIFLGFFAALTAYSSAF